jgi:hypothetical protein
MRKSGWFLAFMLLCAVAVVSLFFYYPTHTLAPRDAARQAQKELVRKLNITDLCLFTEARYTRHPSQADWHSAFQDHPLALEHFPSGSILLPPGFMWDNQSKASGKE